jgi:hypothetical protein
MDGRSHKAPTQRDRAKNEQRTRERMIELQEEMVSRSHLSKDAVKEAGSHYSPVVPGGYVNPSTPRHGQDGSPRRGVHAGAEVTQLYSRQVIIDKYIIGLSTTHQSLLYK